MLTNKLWMTAAIAAIVSTPIFGFTSRILAQNYDEIYVFGDSLSDVGNIYEATNKQKPPSPPYFQGRYSDGPVWVEYLASKLQLTPNPNTNFAYGGATTGNSKATPPGLLTQIDSFKTMNSRANPKALYVLWAGGNDYLSGATNTAGVVNNLAIAVKSLTAVGAKNIVVVNLTDLGKIPATRTTQRANSLDNLTKKHNTELAASLNNLRQQLGSNTNIKYLDANSIFNRVIENPQKFGFKNVTAPCLSNGIICDNPNEYLFWDSIHPTTAAHKLLVELGFPALTSESERDYITFPQFVTLLSVLLVTALGVGLILKRKKAIGPH